MAQVASVHRKKLPRTLMTHLSANPPTDSVSVRRYLCDALRIDLVGPRPGDAASQHERLPQAPSRWYLTGFLAPGDAPEEQPAQDSEEALDEPAEPLHGSDDASTPERGSHKRLFLPSSMGLSMLVDESRIVSTSPCRGATTPRTERRRGRDAPGRADHLRVDRLRKAVSDFSNLRLP